MDRKQMTNIEVKRNNRNRVYRYICKNGIVSNPDIFADPAPVVGVAEHQESGILLDLKVWCETSKYYDVRYYLEEQVKISFDKANITIPYPQMDVRVIK